MITRIEGLPENVVGFRASGTVTERDYESVIVPVLDRTWPSTVKVGLLYQIAPDFEGFDAHASWDDPGLGRSHRASWDRVALVTDLGWLRRTTRALGFAMPVDVRVVENRAVGEAKAWLGA